MIVLASNSPRRKQLLALGGWKFQVSPVQVDESLLPEETPLGYVLRLAREKAKAVNQEYPQGSIVVAADTIVVHGTEILGKPIDSTQAIEMLQRLRGRAHQVYTALAVLHAGDVAVITDWCATDVFMRDYSVADMKAYVASSDPLDKAGAYAIQHRLFNPVERVEGCYANVVGLPLCHLARLLRQFEVHPENDLLEDCLAGNTRQCAIQHIVL